MIQEIRNQSAPVEKRKTIIINGRTVTYTIRRSFRAKHVRLEMRPQTGLTVIVPHRYQIGQLSKLLKSKERWLSSNLARFSHFQSLHVKKGLRSGDTVTYLGRDLELVKQENHSGTGILMLVKNMLAVNPMLFENGTLELALEQWFRAEANKLIKEKADKLSSQIGISYKRIFIRGQKTRWASCSHKKNLSFNWKLIMAPEPVIDYVIIHELTHLKEMNHSKRFWELVAQYCPRWQEYKKWLKQHEADLIAKLHG